MAVRAVRVLRVIADAEQTDAELLGRFIDRRDEAAFALLVRRHGAMVFGVCRRLLPEPDAEDAFQAVFLVLARKARSVLPREAVGNWLHGVARRAALLARRSIARRRERRGGVPEMPVNPPDELRAMLDEELGRLPDAYRAVVVLCDLEGRTRREAAAVLGWPEGTVAGRLVRAREILARRLAPSASIAALLAGTASARVPEILPPAAIPPGVSALTREVLGAMARGKLVKAATAVILLACAGFGMVLHAGQKPAAGGDPVPAGPATPADPPRADAVVWGKEVGGLQAGLVLKEAACRPGGSVHLEIRLRNVGKADVAIRYVLLRDRPPTVTGAEGRRVTVAMPPSPRYYVPPTERVVTPGETIRLYNPEIAVESKDRARQDVVQTPTIAVDPGRYTALFGGMLTSHPTLATGSVEFEVKNAKPEPFTAWGKEAGGLQAGLEVKENRAYRLGETITLAVRVRNVSKQVVKFEYVRQYLDENPPAVTASDGKAIPQMRVSLTGLLHPPVGVSLEPGQEAVLETRIHGASGQRYELRPKEGGGALAGREFPLRVGTGKVALQYKKVFGNSSIGRIRIDPDLADLATGKLEIEVADHKPVRRGPFYLPSADGLRELKGKELEAYQTTNAWLEERLGEAESVKVGSTYADVCKYFRGDGGLTTPGKSRFVNVLCPFMKIDVEFEAFKGGTIPPAAKVTRVSRPYFERGFAD